LFCFRRVNEDAISSVCGALSMRDKFDGYVSALASGTGPQPAQASPRSVDAASRRQNSHKRRDWPFESIRRDFKKWRPDTRRSSICVIVKGQNERTHTKAREYARVCL